jgi:hypothetical protein
MDYRIFRNGAPSDNFTKDMQELCELDDVQREALAVWFESTSDFNIYQEELPKEILASTLLPNQFRKAAEPIRFILNAWKEYSLEITDIQRDLLLCGLNAEQIELVTRLLDRLSHVKDRVWIDGWEGTAQVIGLPTIEDANIAWDARGVFGGENFYYSTHHGAGEGYRRCLGLTCMSILELMVSDTNGSKQHFAVQMDESTFRKLLRAMNRAEEQLDSLNALIEPIKVNRQNPRG